MKVYEFGDKNKPSIMLFPGTCCYWKTNFGHVLDGLQEHFHTLVVSYSGFDDTENSTFISELDEVLKVENYIKDKLDGKLFAAYGCSLGGSFVSLLIGRQNIHIDHGIIGSSDMDQAPKWLAKLETAIMMPMFYPFITGKESGILKKVFEKKMNEGNDSSEYMKKFMEIMGKGSGIDFSFISKESMKNQFCTDLYTSVGEHINVPERLSTYSTPRKWVRNILSVTGNVLLIQISANLICSTKNFCLTPIVGSMRSAGCAA